MNKPNWEVLSLTRFFLASIVMIGHLQNYSKIGFLKYFSNLGSTEAIIGFLLISGFSIGKSIIKKKEDYFKRRIQRIYPVYFASIVFHIVVIGVQINIKTVFILIINLLFLNQVLTNASLVGPAWTLAAEVGLYALAPFFLKQTKTTLLWYIFISFILYVGYTCGESLFHWSYFSGTKYGINIPVLAFIWIAGFVLAIYPTSFKQNLKTVAILLIGHILLTIGIQILYRIKHNNITSLINTDLQEFFSRSFCLFVVYLVMMNINKISFTNSGFKKIFNLAGNISYPLYLTHWTSFYLLNRLSLHNPYIMIMIALLISYIVYYVFDIYSRKRKPALDVYLQ